MAINPISQETKEAILRKSVQGLPLNPTEQGYSSQDVRDAMVKPIIDDTNSIASEINRIATEVETDVSGLKTNPNFVGSVSANRKANTRVGDKSVALGTSSSAITSNSFASGDNCEAGMLGYYWNYIGSVEGSPKVIYLSNTNTGLLETEPTVDSTFVNPYAVGDTFSFQDGGNTFNAYNIGTITAIDHNKVTVSALPSGTPKAQMETEHKRWFYVLEKSDKGTVELGVGAVAFGTETKAINESAFAEGRGTTAYGKMGHAEGKETKAGYAAHAEGYLSKAHGHMAHAEGESTEATENWSHAENYYAKATAPKAHAEGDHTTASGSTSHAEGYTTTASAYASHTEGSNTTASNNYAHAEGKSTTASGLTSHAEGDTATASGSVSHAEGYNTQATQYCSHAEGAGTIASSTYAHAEGYNTTASGGKSHAEGQLSKATGSITHAEGYNTTASGYCSHAEGDSTVASANRSHAEGYNTTASGANAHTSGEGTVANHKSQFVFGEYNVADTSTSASTQRGNYLEIVGNGTSSNRSNARTLDWNGNETIAGNLRASGLTDGTTTKTMTQILAGSPTYTAGNGISISNNAIALNTSTQNTLSSVAGKENASNKVTSISSSSNDTQYPSAKCVYDAVESNKVFVASFYTTTYQEVLQNFNEGRYLVCNRDGFYYQFLLKDSANQFQFYALDNRKRKLCWVNPYGDWNYNEISLEDSDNKVTAINSYSTDTQYPSAKAVYDGLNAKQGTISDLSTIRSNASLGATAVQPSALSNYATQTELQQGLATKSVVSASASEVSGATEMKSLTINGTNWNLPSGGGEQHLYRHCCTLYYCRFDVYTDSATPLTDTTLKTYLINNGFTSTDSTSLSWYRGYPVYGVTYAADGYLWMLGGCSIAVYNNSTLKLYYEEDFKFPNNGSGSVSTTNAGGKYKNLSDGLLHDEKIIQIL